MALIKALVPGLLPPPQPSQPLAAESHSRSQGQEQELAQAGTGIAPWDAPSDATLCHAWPGAEALHWLHPLLGVLVLGGPEAQTVPVPLWPGTLCWAGLAEEFLTASPGYQLGSCPRPPWVKAQKKGSGCCF